MLTKRWAGLRTFTGALLASALLSACGGGDLHSSNLLSGTAATNGALVDAAVHLRCADGSVFQTRTNASGMLLCPPKFRERHAPTSQFHLEPL